jgi:hypothetical protein
VEFSLISNNVFGDQIGWHLLPPFSGNSIARR